MLRRRIFAYSVLYTAGIAAGYLFFECYKCLIAVILIIILTVSVQLIDLEYIPETTKRERVILISILLIGFMVFTFAYIRMNQRITDIRGESVDITRINSLDAEVLSIQEKDNGCTFVVRPTEYRGMDKIQCEFNQGLDRTTEDMLGAEVTLYGKMDKPNGADNPGCFNYKTYLYSKGISYTFSSKHIKINRLNNNPYWKYRKYIYKLRERFLNLFSDNLQVRGFIKGVVFGDKSDIDDETIEEFTENSTGHILAVSGLHVGFLFSLLRIISRRRKSWTYTFIIMIILILYGEMTGWSASTMRAVLVLTLRMFTIYVRRPNDLLSLVSTASVIILTYNPYQLINSGFQLSFIALLGIAFLTSPLSFFVGEKLSAMISIQLAIIPIISYTFSGVNLLSCFINIPIVFMSSILVPMCLIALGILAIAGIKIDILIRSIEIVSELIVSLNSKLSWNGKLFTDVTGINAGVLVALYVFMFFLSSEWVQIRLIRLEFARIRKMIPLLIIPCLLIGIATYNPFLNDDLVFVSVGQGDCTHIRANNHNVLIDGGGSATYNVGKKILKPYLLKNGVRLLDMALVTHLHMDHYQGLEELVDVFPVGGLGIPSTYDVDSDINISYGNRIKLSSDVYVEPIWPVNNSERLSASDKNENNMVYIIYCHGRKAMITGDLGKEDELKMVNYYRGKDTLKCDILKVGHHGSKSSSCQEFLDAVSPEIAVISVGKNNVYGHPHQETLNMLDECGIKTYRTDLNGAVGIDIYRNVVKVDTMR